MDNDLGKFAEGVELDEEEEHCAIPTDSDIERWRTKEDLDEAKEAEEFKEVIKKKSGKGKKTITEPVVTSRWNLRQKDNVPIPKKAEMLTQKKRTLNCQWRILMNQKGGPKAGVLNIVVA